jgi:hypothetical protein
LLKGGRASAGRAKRPAAPAKEAWLRPMTLTEMADLYIPEALSNGGVPLDGVAVLFSARMTAKLPNTVTSFLTQHASRPMRLLASSRTAGDRERTEDPHGDATRTVGAFGMTMSCE